MGFSNYLFYIIVIVYYVKTVLSETVSTLRQYIQGRHTLLSVLHSLSSLIFLYNWFLYYEYTECFSTKPTNAIQVLQGSFLI